MHQKSYYVFKQGQFEFHPSFTHALTYEKENKKDFPLTRKKFSRVKFFSSKKKKE